MRRQQKKTKPGAGFKSGMDVGAGEDEKDGVIHKQAEFKFTEEEKEEWEYQYGSQEAK